MLPDVPGSLARILAIVAEREANVLEVHHDRASVRPNNPATTRLELHQASVELVAETRGFDHVNEILDAIRAGGFTLICQRRRGRRMTPGILVFQGWMV